ncbi:interferon-induced protein 44-like isoform X2 [Crassostrea virginica]
MSGHDILNELRRKRKTFEKSIELQRSDCARETDMGNYLSSGYSTEVEAQKSRDLHENENKDLKNKIKEMRKNRERLEVPWRDVGENFFSVQKKHELKKFIEDLRFPDDCQHINLFMTGHIGSGKSCFANTLKTVFEDTGEIASPAVTYGIDKKSETRKLHEITLKTYENGKSIRIYDCRGIEPSGDEQAFQDDLCKIISGHVMKDYVFEETTIEPKYKLFRDNPSISDKMHCVLFVMKATDENNVPPILDAIKDFLGQNNIPLRLILTSMDQLELYELGSLRSVFLSRDAKVKVERAKGKFGLQDNQILPVANYVSGINQDVNRDVLALQAAKNILQEANSFIADNM